MASRGSALTLGTAGHIDHGKTVLVEALTGVDTDRLPEEQRRGISIELGFAPLELPSGRLLGVVDVPGHERFVRTMVAGATDDLFLLAVAADDGVMPQTREHLAVIRMLGVQAGVVALTKTDLVDPDRLALTVREVTELLARGPYEGAPVVPVCAPAGDGLGELIEALDRLAAGSGGPHGDGDEVRLHVDRSFSLKGIGTVVTGTLWSGTLRVGDEVRIEPRGTTARVRSIQVHDQPRESAGAGRRVAVNLAGLDRAGVARGDLVTDSTSEIRSTHLIDAVVELLPGTGSLDRGARVQLHHGTRDSPARITPIESDALPDARRSYAQLRLEQAVMPAAGDRFVLRRIAPPDTIGGGVVIDPAPRKHGPGAAHVERLRLLESGDPLARLEAQLAGSPSGLADGDADGELLERLRSDGRAAVAGGERRRYFAPAQLERARERLLSELSRVAGGRTASRGALADAAGVSEEAAQALLDELVASGAVTTRGVGFTTAREERPDDPLDARLLALLLEDFLEPRGPGAIGAELGLTAAEARELLERVRVDGRIERLKPGVYYHPQALSAAERQVVAICERDGSVTIAGLRDELGTSRKYAQALLEHFDSRRLTRRDGDVHVLRRRSRDPV